MPAFSENAELRGQEESGRGLLIMDATSTEWDWHTEDNYSEKTSWALIE